MKTRRSQLEGNHHGGMAAHKGEKDQFIGATVSVVNCTFTATSWVQSSCTACDTGYRIPIR